MISKYSFLGDDVSILTAINHRKTLPFAFKVKPPGCICMFILDN